MFGVTNRLLDAGNAAVHGDKAKVDAIRSALLDAHVKTVRGKYRADPPPTRSLPLNLPLLQRRYFALVPSVAEHVLQHTF